MKFTPGQIQFLMTKMTISNIEEFNAEASSFVPIKTKKSPALFPQDTYTYKQLLSLEDINFLKNKYFLVTECSGSENWDLVQEMFPDGRLDYNEDEGLYVNCKKPRTPKPVSSETLCKALKKDGNPCCNKKKIGEFCGRHSPKSSSSVEVAVSSDTE